MIETRVVNLKYEPYDVRIDRRSVCGNPYVIGRDGNRNTVIELHMARWRRLLAHERTHEVALNLLHQMKGKRLGCHCAPSRCHGDNYIKLIAEFCS